MVSLAAVVALFLVVAQVATVAAAPGQGSAGERAGSAAPIDKEPAARPESRDRDEDRRRVRRQGEPECRQEDQGTDPSGQRRRQGPQDDGRCRPEDRHRDRGQDQGRDGDLALAGQRPRRRGRRQDPRQGRQAGGQAARASPASAAPRLYPLVKPVETSVAILAARGQPGVGRREDPRRRGLGRRRPRPGHRRRQRRHRRRIRPPRPRSSSTAATSAAADFDHDYNWWDPTGICGDEPCDNAGHGTHTMGTMVGGDGPGPFTPDIGVAPGAKWMAAKGCEDFFCTDTSLLSAGEFILKPTDLDGENPEAPNAPRHRQQLLGQRPGRHVLSRDRPGLARRRGSSRSSRPATPARSAARAARPATSSSRSAPAPPTSTTTSPSSPAAARPCSARSTRMSPPRASTSSRASRVAGTRPSTAPRWRPRTSRAPSR